MTSLRRPKAREAGPDLLVLQKWEEFCGWFLDHTGRWPKVCRFTLTQRLQNHALDVLEELVLARYETGGRDERLRRVNLSLERMRFLLRAAKTQNATTARGFESAVRRIDEVGRMLYGWREALKTRSPS